MARAFCGLRNNSKKKPRSVTYSNDLELRTRLVRVISNNKKKLKINRTINLVPRVSHLTAGDKMRDPGNEVVAQ